MFDDQAGDLPDQVCGVAVLGGVEDLMALARRQPIDQVIVALPGEAEVRLRTWMQHLRSLPVDVCFCPQLGGACSPTSRITRVAGLPMLSLLEKPLTGWSYVAVVVDGIRDRLVVPAAALIQRVTVLLADFATVWAELFPAEQARIVQLLVERVDVQEGALEVRIRAEGLASLVGELRQQCERRAA